MQGPKIEHRTMNPKTYDLLFKVGYDPTEDVAMGKLPVEVTDSKEAKKDPDSSLYITIEEGELSLEDAIDAHPGLEEQVKATVDELKEVNLGTAECPCPTYVSAHLAPSEEVEYIALLSEFQDVFAWTYTEMPRLDRKVEVHHLAMKKGARPVKQRQRRFRPELVPSIEVGVNRMIDA
ncbi:hypothetical protein LIER_30442 [Lithospermum erythrorhizon]|uniref:Uncharacterized protein n=1 Tax=Lithospermum erythrorhizon TaxID=34254 RepID=A0AAV3RRN2_LITER